MHVVCVTTLFFCSSRRLWCCACRVERRICGQGGWSAVSLVEVAKSTASRRTSTWHVHDMFIPLLSNVVEIAGSGMKSFVQHKRSEEMCCQALRPSCVYYVEIAIFFARGRCGISLFVHGQVLLCSSRRSASRYHGLIYCRLDTHSWTTWLFWKQCTALSNLARWCWRRFMLWSPKARQPFQKQFCSQFRSISLWSRDRASHEQVWCSRGKYWFCCMLALDSCVQIILEVV